MYPTLKSEQRLLVSRWIKTAKQIPERGDIIVIEAPDKDYITKEEADTNNPKAIYEEKNRGIWGNFSYHVLEIGKKNYIKRVIGLPGEHVEIKNGKVYINEEPLREEYLMPGIVTDWAKGAFGNIIVPEGYVFVMGDNRNESTDSRAFGCVPIDKIESKLWIRFWPIKEFGTVK